MQVLLTSFFRIFGLSSLTIWLNGRNKLIFGIRVFHKFYLSLYASDIWR
ncbi:hypothetical protein WN943_012013 [Citrus x changshan-huyou]